MPSLAETRTAASDLSSLDWESLWSPYGESTYQAVLSRLGAADVVLDIGAGDLRLACRMAARVRRVYAIEQHGELLSAARHASAPSLPDNLIPLQGDARSLPYPQGLTVGVLLMRHCHHFPIYIDRLSAAGADRLITNARWRMGVEDIDLRADRLPFRRLRWGWYACRCGGMGFRPGPPEGLTEHVIEAVTEVSDCPRCRDPQAAQSSSESFMTANLMPGE